MDEHGARGGPSHAGRDEVKSFYQEDRQEPHAYVSRVGRVGDDPGLQIENTPFVKGQDI